jgi:serine/threonine protein kinase
MACKAFRTTGPARHEADVLSKLAHPNIVRSFGTYRSNYLLLEFLEGPTLSRLLGERPHKRLSVSDAIRVAIHLGTALQHIHDRGFVHLDVKPSNVIVVNGRPVFFDFGTARVLSAARPNYTVGTDPYISPEECLLERVTAAADVFSLGVTLYELLTGDLPFGEPSRKVPFPQTVRLPVPARAHRKYVSTELDRLVLSCLCRDPAGRPRLEQLLPALHDLVRTGPRMWPTDFDPARETKG